MKIIESELNIFNGMLISAINEMPNEVSKNISDFVFSKSKKIRPSLVLLLSKAINDKVSESIYNLAVATEIIHNATLIHDDIIDNAQKRRGRVSLNIELGNNLSVLSGDLLLAKAVQKLTLCGNLEVLNLFSTSLLKMCNGEINQHFSINEISSIDEYILKSQNKTAELFIASLESLCLIENIEYKDAVKNFALNFGIAFQIKDDLVNILKTDKTKPALSDIYNGIYTFPVILLAKENPNFAILTKDEIIEELSRNENIKLKTQAIIKEYATKAIDSLTFIRDNQYKKKIIELTQDLYKAF